jgi:DNA-binding response OmpR family regulator
MTDTIGTSRPAGSPDMPVASPAVEPGAVNLDDLYALVVDDHDSICRLVAMALASIGVDAASYVRVKAAIASLEHKQPDVIFLDMALTDGDAVDMLESLAAGGYTGVVQLITGGRPEVVEGVQRMGLDCGLELYPPIMKPFRPAAIREVIDRVRSATSHRRHAAPPRWPGS